MQNDADVHYYSSLVFNAGDFVLLKSNFEIINQLKEIRCRDSWRLVHGKLYEDAEEILLRSNLVV